MDGVAGSSFLELDVGHTFCAREDFRVFVDVFKTALVAVAVAMGRDVRPVRIAFKFAHFLLRGEVLGRLAEVCVVSEQVDLGRVAVFHEMIVVGLKKPLVLKLKPTPVVTMQFLRQGLILKRRLDYLLAFGIV